ncbi:rab-like GTPase activating protein [Trypanosoma theileri]|uniref:Rab-like GTPase activating protein n=1 Tax=Trypanosoma theileri TaxID=67003 RepID=A0A1X0NLQ9_9TRYP|nr:rab-like GTPase activating protein [Trypanosoma theileri]ORC85607.1 rab-like GTPase activating protein [Trypanosoma theileri]
MLEESSVFGHNDMMECDDEPVEEPSVPYEKAKVTAESSLLASSSSAQQQQLQQQSGYTSRLSGAHTFYPRDIETRERNDNGDGGSRTSSKQDAEEEREFVDEFGFVVDEEEKNRELLYVKNIDGRKIVRREVKWANMASDWDNVNTKRHDKLKERCRKGIPARLRGIAWQLLLGSRRQMLDPANIGTYECLRTKELADTELCSVISRDLSRTFPKHILFREEGGVGQTFLRNVLHAYASVDPEVGYVQGMGFVVGALSTQMGEEETFWALHALMYSDRYKLRELYRPGFPMLQQFFYQLKQLMARLLPKLYQHFENIGVDPSFYASQWFLTLFVYHFQFRALLRIWDIFMSEGWKIIFRVSIALMKWEEKRLLELQLEEVLPALKNLHEGKNPDEIVRRAQSIKFKTAELNAYAEEYWRAQNACKN